MFFQLFWVFFSFFEVFWGFFTPYPAFLRFFQVFWGFFRFSYFFNFFNPIGRLIKSDSSDIEVRFTRCTCDGIFASWQLSASATACSRLDNFPSRTTESSRLEHFHSFTRKRYVTKTFLPSNFQLPDRSIFAIPLSLPRSATAAASLAAAEGRLVQVKYNISHASRAQKNVAPI